MGEWPFIFDTSVSVFSLLLFFLGAEAQSIDWELTLWISQYPMIELFGGPEKRWSAACFGCLTWDPKTEITGVSFQIRMVGWPWYPVYIYIDTYIYIYWLVVWNIWIIFPFSWEFHDPNGCSPSFFRGVGSTTNQWKMVDMMWFDS